MINLMPDQAKADIRAARVNVVLVRYIIIVILAFAFLLLLLFGTYVILTQTKTSAQELIDASAAKNQAYTSTVQQLNSLNISLNKAKSVVSQEIDYSTVLTNIGRQMPAGTVLDTLSLSAASFNGTPTTLRAYAKTQEDGVALREQFQKSAYFSKVTLDSFSGTGGATDYPVVLSLTVTFNKAITK